MSLSWSGFKCTFLFSHIQWFWLHGVGRMRLLLVYLHAVSKHYSCMWAVECCMILWIKTSWCGLKVILCSLPLKKYRPRGNMSNMFWKKKSFALACIHFLSVFVTRYVLSSLQQNHVKVVTPISDSRWRWFPWLHPAFSISALNSQAGVWGTTTCLCHNGCRPWLRLNSTTKIFLRLPEAWTKPGLLSFLNPELYIWDQSLYNETDFI